MAITLNPFTGNFDFTGGSGGGGGSVNSVNASAPLNSTGGLNPNISLTGIVPVANGGTGLSVPGTSGNVLTSNGSAWISSAPSGASSTFSKETFVLSGTNITNQFIDLAHIAKTDSIVFLIQGLQAAIEGASYDYSVSYTGGSGGNTRITFLNGIATGGISALIATDIVQINYVY